MSSDYTYDEQVRIGMENGYIGQIMLTVSLLVAGSILPFLHLDLERPGHPPSHLQSPPTKQRFARLINSHTDCC